MKPLIFITALLFTCSVNGQPSSQPYSGTPEKEKESTRILRQPDRLVPVTNPVYQLLEWYESTGETGFLPQVKPWTKAQIVEYLENLYNSSAVTNREKKVLINYMQDISAPINGLKIKEHSDNKTYTVVGAGAKISGKTGSGDHATWSVSNIAEPFIGGDLGKHFSFFAGIGAAVERLAPDIFYEGYVKNGMVHFPHENTGYASHPYQFDFETMRNHYNVARKSGGGPPVQEGLAAGIIYHTELSSSWADGKFRIHFHNHRRVWGHASENLVLSADARRFPGIDIVLEPAPWMRYSFLTGSLFSYPSQQSDYKAGIYGYDTGEVQKLLTLHMLEFTPVKPVQITFSGGSIWSKRLELAYLAPFMLPHLAQIDVGDHDNLSMGMDAAFLIPDLGKISFSIFVDEFSFTDEGDRLKKPRNRYAWQARWSTSLLSSIIPGTLTETGYTRVTPFVYTHYPETDFNPLGNGRPLDMTYTNDNANLGFYMPPNSGEFKLDFTNMAVPDLTLKLKNRFMIHGTNDLSGKPFQIFGDVYRHQLGDVYQYPLMDFTRDGIYDYTWFTEFKTDKKIRALDFLNYFRVVATLGYSHTWWKSNQSGVAAPPRHRLFTGELGLIVDF